MTTARPLDPEALRGFLAGVLDIDPARLQPGTHFVRDLGVNSLMALEVAVALEMEYGVSIAEAELAEVATLAEAHDLLERKRA